MTTMILSSHKTSRILLRSSIAVALVSMAQLSGHIASAQAAVVSTFDTGSDGWSTINLSQPITDPPTVVGAGNPLSWSGFGGNPGGFFRPGGGWGRSGCASLRSFGRIAPSRLLVRRPPASD
jgi:hypothetical protein